ncbi:hypothetical protein [Maritalea porphyrae]|uniref:hypothetical protein n=1 Tax=Maritalea porphyrae TaxID=880732 RepID=UPI0022B017CC|nr:hypothetical protein [Maritalea porphyrae]MCZ4274003.1 hypothetical protein [Maritalea porphyrae]
MQEIFELDASAFAPIANKLDKLSGQELHHAFRRGINRRGNKRRTAIIRALVEQTGLPTTSVRKSIATRRASYSALEYALTATGAHINIAHFGGAQTEQGVSASPWGRSQTFKGAFIVSKLNGLAFKRESASRFPIKQVFGPAIPVEIMKEPAINQWSDGFTEDLVDDVRHEIDFILFSR